MRHRGPDDDGESLLPFGAATLGLAHRRLSILDLSPLGHQPMIHPQTGDQIVFNGEIYNFHELRKELESAGEQFRGHSDTEVLLHALARWGADCIKRLQGMFAFGFYNAREQYLLLARDSVGIKPLYIAQAADTILFASELRAILATDIVPRKLDRAGMAGLLAYGAVQAPCTMIENVRSFPAGHYQIIRPDNRVELPVKFWDFPEIKPFKSENDLLLQLRRTLSYSVRDHLVADVPVGVFLSSGIDSTIIAAMSMNHATDIRSFTVGFADQPDLSESPVARQTGEWLWLNHTDIQVTGSDAQNWAMTWLNAMDQPSVDGLNVYVISKAVRDAGITVALSGLGADELFGGYPSFSDVPKIQRYLRRMRFAPASVRRTIGKMLTLRASDAVKQKMMDMLDSDGSTTALALHRRRAMSDRQMRTLGLDAAELGLNGFFLSPDALGNLKLSGDVVADVSRLETNFYQGNMLLRDADVNGMAHSLEIRVPMLDQRLLNLIHSASGELRLPEGKPDKHLLRSAFIAEFRPGLLQQKKKGFTLPIKRWMIGPMREMCESSITRLKQDGVLRAEGVDQIWNAFLKDPESQIWTRAFILCVLGNWMRISRIVV